jgi:hypothetical protein
MKWTYKECDVKVTATALDSPARPIFTPIVVIDCKSVGPHKMLSTSECFLTAELAEQRGMNMARKWIDEKWA